MQHQGEASPGLPGVGRCAALLICAAILPYLPILPASFLMETHYLLPAAWEKLMAGFDNAFRVPIGGGFRPLTTLSVFWTAWSFEGSEVAHRSINFLIHAATTIVSWRVALRLGLSARGALIAGVLFAWSPTLGFLVPWIAGRPDMLAGLSAGLVFLAHVRYREQPSGRRLTLVYLAVLMLVMSKEVGLLIPALLFAVSRGHRLRYAPLLVVCLAWGLLRIHFHNVGYAGDEEIQRLYSPLTLFREPARILEVLDGGGRILFSLLTCAIGPWQVPSGALGVIASLAGLAMFAGLMVFGIRRAPLGVGFGLALLIPSTPFLDKSVGYYLYSPAVFLIPVLVMWADSVAQPSRRVLLGSLMAVSLVGCLHHVWLWNKAAVRLEQELEPLRFLVQQTIEECRASNGKPHLVQVFGLPISEGPIWLFPPRMSPYGLTGPFFPYYRTTDESDEDWLQSQLIHWRTAPLTADEEDWVRTQGFVHKTIRVH